MFLAAMLCGIIIVCLGEFSFVPLWVKKTLFSVFVVTAFFIPGFAYFLPLIAYDMVREKHLIFSLVWPIPLVFLLGDHQLWHVLFLLLVGFIEILLALRSSKIEQDVVRYKDLRDSLQEQSLALEKKNRDLRDKQDYEVQLATLDERGRIAREIHDNVGHLLTRSVLQVEAYQAVHEQDEATKHEFKKVGDTLHEALDTVRESVHDLHHDSFDLEMQIEKLKAECPQLDVRCNYDVENLTEPVGYCFLAIIREAFSNTLKHSDATRVDIKVVEHPAFYRLSLHDNGSMGYTKDAKPTLQGKGMGLSSMEDRVRGLQGVFRIKDGKGFTITASIPKETIDREVQYG